MSNLIVHASRGNLKAVRDLIKAGVDVDARDKQQRTALMVASRKGNLEIVKALVDTGAALDLQGNEIFYRGNTALMYACRNGHLGIVKILINSGADLNVKDQYGQTALMCASDRGYKKNVNHYLEIVKALIDAGADLNVKDPCGRTALMRAPDRGYTEIVKILQDAESRKASDSNSGDRRSQTMFISLFTALGYLSKVDGKVSQEEIDFAANLMNKMQLDADQRQQAEDLFRMGKQAPAIVLTTLFGNLKYEYKNDSKSLYELMKNLMQLAYLDNVISGQKRLAVKEIAMQLGIAKSALDAIEVSLVKKSQNTKASTAPNQNQNQHSPRDNRSAKKPETANSNSNHFKLTKISADLFQITGYLIKIDGRVSQKEIKVVTKLMNEMRLERDQRCQAEDLFRRGKQASEENIIALVSNLQDQYYEIPEILNILMMILVEVTYSDRSMTDPEEKMIRTIAMQHLRLDKVTFNIIKIVAYYEFQRIKHLDLQDAYQMLGISDAASHQEVKQAYRNLLRTYHPDALQSKGLPKEMLVFGKRLSQKFNLAYDRIRTDRQF